jgi:hypothetical protein
MNSVLWILVKIQLEKLIIEIINQSIYLQSNVFNIKKVTFRKE